MRMEYFDSFVVPQLHTSDVFNMSLSCTQGRHLSAVKQRQLRIAISTTDLDNMKWCWIYPPADQCPDKATERLGDLARLVHRAENCNVYRTYDSFMGHETLTLAPETLATRMSRQYVGIYLIPDNTSRIKWIGSGRGYRGRWFRGLELEREVIAKMDQVAANYALK